MSLLDAPKTRQQLVRNGVVAVLCGHEHQPPDNVHQALCEDGELLVLQAGCPTLDKGRGNYALPQFSVYALDCHDDKLTLHWFRYELDPLHVSHFGSLEHDGCKWQVSAARPPTPPSPPRRPRISMRTLFP
jgi:hypothetical protein